ncbi:NHLP bacteriocin export ABC transporter permease/ATPase subunit [Trinickia dinghuensis]|uniref:Cyclolysin secretion/processing ATP-binding protein CyaB n=1 Tax=Trinickia dinghuensis TaxID=2291023 RepID=A0A3D8JQU2_9BURK|nr:NHLP bacteriocin export ABC transporter permease/ATPase subunit [Trinickia dinghuensis]RDU95493.1 NHLP bacteriocin export ABC transporter permease/ATPase subunit [Trinickia dinghuensis]
MSDTTTDTLAEPARSVEADLGGDPDALALQRHQRTDERNLNRALGAMAALLDAGTPPASADGGPETVLAATLARVLAASGVQTTFKAVDPALDAFDSLRQLARQARVATRKVKLEGGHWWQEDAGPLLGSLKDGGRPVALLPQSGGGYRIEDLESGRVSRLDATSAAGLEPHAWMFFRTFPARAVGLLDLLRFGLVGTRKDRLTVIACGLLGGLLALFTPLATGVLVDHVVPDARSSELVQLVLLLITATLGVAAFELVRGWSALRIEGRLSVAAESAIIERLISLPAPFFRNYAAGDLAQRALSINSILQLISHATQSAVLSWMFGLFSFIYMFVLSWQLGLVATALVALVVLVTVGFNLWRLRIERRLFALQGTVASRVLQILGGIGKLRVGGAENRAFVLWARDFTRQKQLGMAVRALGNVLEVFNASFVVIASGTLFAAITWFRGDVTTGLFVAFNTAFIQCLTATLALAAALTESLGAIPLYERARPILLTSPEEQASQAQAGPLQGNIDISRVTFSYAKEGPPVLDDISLHVSQGEFVAVVGPSGSGKSTLFRLLLGFEQPASGAVYYDGQDLAGLDAGSVRRQLGVVLQNGKLMPGDIFTNIVGSAPRTLDQAWEAARMAGMDEDIRAMPMGMHTVIAEGMNTISGGQRQRLMIARALVNRPAVLLFDEATSALDNQTQAIVTESIGRLGATRIVIAHRLSTIRQADRIVVIDAGKVVETGSYDALIALNGHFAALAKRQQL